LLTSLQEDTTHPCVELQLDKLGTFAVTFRSKTETFQMTMQGGLYHARLNRNVSLRLPKKAIDTTINYNLQVWRRRVSWSSFNRTWFIGP
jgi:hypothetical protein